ncbi:MAG TPA: SpoIID/LytB domain-containing protein [Acidisarcina sp.]
MTRPICIMALLLVSLRSAPSSAQQELSFRVLGLFHPRELIVEPAGGQTLLASAPGYAPYLLNGEPGHSTLAFHAEGNRVMAGERSAAEWNVSTRDGSRAALLLEVPGKLRRLYEATLVLTAHHGELVAIISMDRETAVASVVAAELTASSPIEAMKAQAVAARSFLVSGRRHAGYDFCDTTHCQFLRSPPAASSGATRAASETRGMVLEYEGRPIGAMYSSRCGGRTRSLQQVGMNAGDGYPYYGVRCDYCRRHPVRWQTAIGGAALAPRPGNEARRIGAARQWGWSAIPGSDFKSSRKGAAWELAGSSLGHGVGMCQFGAEGMARSGASFRAILQHYYPNTSLVTFR